MGGTSVVPRKCNGICVCLAMGKEDYGGERERVCVKDLWKEKGYSVLHEE